MAAYDRPKEKGAANSLNESLGWSGAPDAAALAWWRVGANLKYFASSWRRVLVILMLGAFAF